MCIYFKILSSAAAVISTISCVCITNLIADLPLDKISDKKASIVAKAVSALAIGVLSVGTLGYYAYYTKKYFFEKKFLRQIEEVEVSIQRGDLEKVKELFQQNPKLKGAIHGYKGRSPTFMNISNEQQTIHITEFLMNHDA